MSQESATPEEATLTVTRLLSLISVEVSSPGVHKSSYGGGDDGGKGSSVQNNGPQSALVTFREAVDNCTR